MKYVDTSYHIIANTQSSIYNNYDQFIFKDFTYNRNQMNRTIQKGVCNEMSQYQK